MKWRGRENSRRTGRDGEEIVARADVLVGREMVRGRRGNHEGGGGFVTGNAGGGKVEVRRWMRGEEEAAGREIARRGSPDGATGRNSGRRGMAGEVAR